MAGKVDVNGVRRDVQNESGGGVTLVPQTPGTVAVTISGLPYEGLVDTKGRAVWDSLADILMHELVGHAIPRVAGSDSGSAIQNENEVRQEMTPGHGTVKNDSYF